VEEVLPALQRAQSSQGNEVMAVEVAERRSGGGVVGKFTGGIRNIPAFYNEVVAEMGKVTWPDRAQLKDTTIKLIIFVLFIGAVLGVVDVLLQTILVTGIPSLFKVR
jgi:preprotein translocase subunit SecE